MKRFNLFPIVLLSVIFVAISLGETSSVQTSHLNIQLKRKQYPKL